MKKGYWVDKTNGLRKQDKLKRNLAFITIISVIVGLDFISKALLSPYFFKGSETKVSILNVTGAIPLNVTIIPAYNKGAAFGLFANYISALLPLRVIVILAMLIYLFSHKSLAVKHFLPILFIIGGALGNIIDFFLYGHVFDFIRIGWGTHYFPIFNPADCFITTGAFWFILTRIKKNKDSLIL